MVTRKEKLQATAEELGLETKGTIAQLKEAIAAAEAEDGPEAESGADPTEPSPEVVTETPPAPKVAADESLPEAPVNPTVAKPKAALPGAVRTYDVMSSFWMQTSAGKKLAQNGGTVRLTEKQAKKYLRHGNIKLAA